MKLDYLDVFEGVKPEGLYTAKYDEDCDIHTTYMYTLSMKRQGDLKVEYKLPIIEDCYMDGKLLDGTNLAFFAQICFKIQKYTGHKW